MKWDPEVYNKFKGERQAPFYDLVSSIRVKPNLKVVDLGCGTGELTSRLADSLPGCRVTGIDSSADMLAEARAYGRDDLNFVHAGIEEVVRGRERYDLIFSNAALQWLNDHEILLPRIISLLNEKGQLAIQVPSNDQHFTHRGLRELASEEPYSSALKGWTRTSPVLDIGTYARIFFENGCSEMTVYEKLYPHVLKDADAVFEWISGTSIIWYLEKLPPGLQQPFREDYREKLREAYRSSPVFYPFRRIIMHGIF